MIKFKYIPRFYYPDIKRLVSPSLVFHNCNEREINHLDVISDVFKKYNIEDANLLNLCRSCGELCSFRADETIFCSTDNVDDLFILVSGVVRMYTISPYGAEVTDLFLWNPGDMVFGFNDSVGGNNGSTILEYCESCTRSTLLKLPLQLFRNAFDTSHSFRQAAMTEQFLRWRNLLNLRHMMMSTTAQTRYGWFLHHYPGLIDRVPHKHVASFLGMNPVTLSRIRRCRAEKVFSTDGGRDPEIR